MTGTDAAAELREVARRAGAELAGAPPQDVLAWALDRFHPQLAIASSMADAVVIHIASQLRDDVPVVFLDTGYHFAETIGMRDAVAAVHPVKLLSVTPVQTVAEQDHAYGERLHERDPDLCCRLRKVEPLERALAPYVAWASGIRRDESDSRRDVQAVEWDAKHSKVKINPLAWWTDADVEAYIAKHGVLVNPLLFDGYGSVGCAPCTHRGEGRTGRWSGTAKTECGLHT